MLKVEYHWRIEMPVGEKSSCLYWPSASALLLILHGLALSFLLPGSVWGQYYIAEYATGLFVHKGVHQDISQENLGDIGNSGFIVGAESVAVIDPGGSVIAAQRLLQALRDRTPLPVSHVILTHFHPDHVAGASVFAEAEHIVAHKNYARAMTQRSVFYTERFPWLLGANSGGVFVQPTVEVAESLTIDLGGRQLLVRAVATAHTDNDLTIVDQQVNALWASDLVFAQRTPSLDGSLTGWISVLSNLSRKNYDLVVPGHGDPGSWDKVVSPQINYLVNLKSTVRDQLDRGVTLSEVMQQAVLQEHDHWLLFEQQHPVNVSKAYTEMEWE